jgi:hypothetical protein
MGMNAAAGFRYPGCHIEVIHSEHIGCRRESAVLGRFRTLSSWDREPYTTKAIIAHLPELTGEIDLVSITSRDINAEIGAFISPK